MTTATTTLRAVETIERAHLEAAGRYIQAIVDHDPMSGTLGHEYRTAESERLWDRFIDRYNDVASGAYARHGPDALRIALAGL